MTNEMASVATAALLTLGCGSNSANSSGQGGGPTGAGGSGGSQSVGAGGASSSSGAAGGGAQAGTGGGAAGGASSSSGATGTGGGASTNGGGTLCTSLGWCEITDTKLVDVCPNDPSIDGSCLSVVAAWSGGIADEMRERLIVWGGGHNDYWGNEVYALDLSTLKMLRLNSPSPQNPTPDSCTGTLPDGTPNSRHTYNGLSYLPDADRMFVFSGGPACLPGGFSQDTWTLDLANISWTAKDPTNGGPPTGMVPTTAYDPNTKKVLVHDTTALWRYDPATNSYVELNTYAPIDYHLTGVVDPVRKLFVLFGGGQARAFDLTDPTYAIKNWDAVVSGCNGIRDAGYPGLAYDPVQNRIVGWAGGDTIYVFNPDTKACAQVTWTGGPGPQQQWGTNGRFRYFPSLGVFGLVNDASQNAFTLRLTLAP